MGTKPLNIEKSTTAISSVVALSSEGRISCLKLLVHYVTIPRVQI